MRRAHMRHVVPMPMFLALIISGCGGAAKYDQAPQTPAAEPPGQPSGASGAATPPSGQPPPPPPAPVASPTDASAATTDKERPKAALGRARNELDVAERELQASAGDCANACRALGSMERATGRLCDLASSTEDRQRCEDAKTKVLAARDRVRSTCGACPGGPSLERSAPIPSLR
jgi:hypothetical protein